MRKITAVLGAGVIAGGLALAQPATANAFPLPGPGQCNYPGVGAANPSFGGWCNYPPLINGVHYRCEWGGFGMFQFSGCNWRDGGEGIVGPPPPELVMW